MRKKEDVQQRKRKKSLQNMKVYNKYGKMGALQKVKYRDRNKHEAYKRTEA